MGRVDLLIINIATCGSVDQQRRLSFVSRSALLVLLCLLQQARSPVLRCRVTLNGGRNIEAGLPWQVRNHIESCVVPRQRANGSEGGSPGAVLRLLFCFLSVRMFEMRQEIEGISTRGLAVPPFNGLPRRLMTLMQVLAVAAHRGGRSQVGSHLARPFPLQFPPLLLTSSFSCPTRTCRLPFF